MTCFFLSYVWRSDRGVTLIKITLCMKITPSILPPQPSIPKNKRKEVAFFQGMALIGAI